MGLSRNVNDWERVASIAAGVALVALAVKKPRWRAMAASTGAGLIARGAGGYCPVNHATGRGRRRDDTKEALGGSRGVRLQDGITIRRPAGELYDYWRTLERLSDIMPDLERVERLDDRRSHWVMRGPAGVTLEWDAEIINDIPGELIGWRSLPGADVASAGSVRFRQTGRGTDVIVTLQYEPPAGKIGAGLAWLAGKGAARRLAANLKRFKDTMEARGAWTGARTTGLGGGQTYAMESR
jgi:uncharacterized membrane protein